MIRKFTRDLTGQTGVKALSGLILMHLGYLEFNLGGKVEKVDQKNRSWDGFFKVFYKKGVLAPGYWAVIKGAIV